MSMQLRLTSFFSRCFMTCGALVLLSSSFVGAETVSVLKDGANVRTGPSTDAQVKMELFQGYPLKVEEKKGDWIKVSDFENDSGWINKSLVGAGNTVIVNAKESINMRSEPSTTATIVAKIERGVVLTRISTKGDWVQVSDFENDSGWINKSLVGAGNTVIVNAKESINMRSEPSTTATIVAKIERGVVLTRISTKGDWVQVKHAKGAEGWISKTLLWP